MLAELFVQNQLLILYACEAIFIHNFSSVMFGFFITVFWFFLNIVEVTTFFKIDDDQHITKTKKHVVDAFKNQKNLNFFMICCINIHKFLYRQSYSKIFVWWFWYDLFQLTKKIKTFRNNEIKIVIVNHTQTWIEIRTTYNWYNRTKMNFCWI